MTKTITRPNEPLHWTLLLMGHVACSDEQVHIKEMRYLETLASAVGANAATQEALESVLANSTSAPSIDACASGVPVSERPEALRGLLALAYAEGVLDDRERTLILSIGRSWGYKAEMIDQWCSEAKERARVEGGNNKESPGASSVAAQLLNGLESLLSKALVDRLTLGAFSNTLQELRNQFLLAGPKYDAAIANCEKVALEDLTVAEDCLKDGKEILEALSAIIEKRIQELSNTATRRGASTAKEVIAQFRKTGNSLCEQIGKDLESVRAALARKRRAAGFFTISFLGKTKSGKSTLHAVLTGEGWDSIGIGTQRTTRYNRVYEWKRVRIIDTPGIGAPGGRTDEEIARSVLDESDIVCFLLTNNNQQETEFRFLGALKEKSKPLIILLNVQENLQQPERLERFLKAPEKSFSMNAGQLGGHVQRIRRYAAQSYGNDLFEIIPVQLLAAQLSRRTDHVGLSKALMRASQLQQFLDAIRVSIIEDGVMRRSQTLLGCSAADLLRPRTWLTEQADVFRSLAQQLESKATEARSRIEKEGNDCLDTCGTDLEAVFHEVGRSVQAFAENHWEDDEKSLTRAWKGHLASHRFQERIEGACQAAATTFSARVESILHEIGKDLRLTEALQAFSFTLEEQDSSTMTKTALKWGGNALGVAAAVMAFIPGLQLFALGAGILAAGFRIFSDWFTSRAEKRSKAVAAISKSLRTQLTQSRDQIIPAQKAALRKMHADTTNALDAYFSVMVSGLRDLEVELSKAAKDLGVAQGRIGFAYAMRVIDFAEGVTGELSEHRIQSTVAGFKREIGRSLQIQVHKPVKLLRSSEELSQILQERISITINPTPTKRRRKP